MSRANDDLGLRMVASWDEPEWWYCLNRNGTRLGDAWVEGSRSEMLALADGIDDGGGYESKRCAVHIERGQAFFWSPRNSARRTGVPVAEAKALAKQIREYFAEETKP